MGVMPIPIPRAIEIEDIACERYRPYIAVTPSNLRAARRRLQGLRNLLKDVQSREAYAEEARAAGAVTVLTKLLQKTDQDETLSLAAEVIAACSGPLSGGKRGRELEYGGHRVWIQEADLGDGLGSRVWIAAHILCRRLVAHPRLVANHEVLEIGSGTGLCGILAAKLGASKVVLTDNETKVLENLRDCCAGNATNSASNSNSRQESSSLNSSVHGENHTSGWNFGNLKVRKLDWEEALPHCQSVPAQSSGDNLQEGEGHCSPPSVPRDNKFTRIIGSDLLYEVAHGVLVAAVIRDRLEQGGHAYIALAVRRKEHLESLLKSASEQGLKASIEQEHVDADSVGIVGREHEYEGGFVTVTFFW